jgi:hypothetical protein
VTQGPPSAPTARSPHSGLAWWRGHRWRADALGAAGPMPRAAVLHGECAEHLEDGGNPLDRAGDVEAEEELWLGGAPTTPVAFGDPR